jgi:hypothetical protein
MNAKPEAILKISKNVDIFWTLFGDEKGRAVVSG